MLKNAERFFKVYAGVPIEERKVPVVIIDDDPVNNNEELIRKIVVERIKSMSPTVKIALGSRGEFLNKDELLKEVSTNTPTGKKIIEIQLRYLRALKEGLV
ncbi:hypothetical protein HZB90_01020 [archaeon]|nr:hypothetical protein [archaeon]